MDLEGPDALLVARGEIVGVAAAEQRIQEPAVDVAVLPPCRLDVRRRGRRGTHGREVERDTDGGVRPARAQRPDGEAVRDQEVVRDLQRSRPVAQAGRLGALGVAEERHAPRLVVRDPVADDVAERVRHPARVLGEARGGLARGPAAAVLQRGGQVAVVERHDRIDAALAQPRREAPVEVDALAVQRAAPVRLHARPGDREAVGLQPQRRHQVEVLAPAVVVVAGPVAGRAARDRAGDAAEPVPDRLAAPVLRRRRPRSGRPRTTRRT